MPFLVIGAIAIQTYSQIKAGKAAQKAAEFNAQALEQQATDAEVRGQQTAGVVRGQGRQIIGSQRVAYAGQGVRIGEGSALDVQADTAYLAELDAQQAIANANREAWGYRTDAESQRRGGAAAASAGRWAAASTVVGGASQLTSSYGYDRSTAGRSLTSYGRR